MQQQRQQQSVAASVVVVLMVMVMLDEDTSDTNCSCLLPAPKLRPNERELLDSIHSFDTCQCETPPHHHDHCATTSQISYNIHTHTPFWCATACSCIFFFSLMEGAGTTLLGIMQRAPEVGATVTIVFTIVHRTAHHSVFVSQCSLRRLSATGTFINDLSFVWDLPQDRSMLQ